MDETCRLRQMREIAENGQNRGILDAAARKQEKGLTLFCVWPSTSARSAGSFGGQKRRFSAAVKNGMALLLTKSRETSVKSRTILTLL